MVLVNGKKFELTRTRTRNSNSTVLNPPYRKSPMLFGMVPSVTPYDLFFPWIRVQNPTIIPIAIISGTAKATHFKFFMHNHRVDQNKNASKHFGKSIHRHSQGVSKTFRALKYKAHRTVIFAIAQLSCSEAYFSLLVMTKLFSGS